MLLKCQVIMFCWAPSISHRTIEPRSLKVHSKTRGFNTSQPNNSLRELLASSPSRSLKNIRHWELVCLPLYSIRKQASLTKPNRAQYWAITELSQQSGEVWRINLTIRLTRTSKWNTKSVIRACLINQQLPPFSTCQNWRKCCANSVSSLKSIVIWLGNICFNCH